MDYINEQNLLVEEAAVDLDINGDGDKEDKIDLSIEYDEEKYPETNGYSGTYLDYYLAEFVSNLQWYIDNLDYAEDWTWFDEYGKALSDEEVANMTNSEKAEAFINGRYAASNAKGSMGGGTPDGNITGRPEGEMKGGMPDRESSDEMKAGTPDSGTTQSATSTTNSSNYSSFAEMVEAYQEDIEEIYSGDKYGKNIVELYNPLEYIGADTTEGPIWARILMGASEGDMSMFSSLNMQAKWIENGTDTDIEWQWNGGHVPSEIFGDSFSLYVDQMYGKYVEGAQIIIKSEPTVQTENGTETEATGTDISSWVNMDDEQNVSFDLAAVAAYRVEGASKAIPGFDVMDYGQEDYVFGNRQKDARHWNQYVLTAFEENYSELEELFNEEVSDEASSETETTAASYTIYYVVIGVAVVLIVICIILKRKK